jgi:hypothetical protein
MTVPAWHTQGRGVTQAGVGVVVVSTCVLVCSVVVAIVVATVGVVVRMAPDVVNAADTQRHLDGEKPK